MPYVTRRYERAKLYEEVWAEAVTTVAKRYRISTLRSEKSAGSSPCRCRRLPLGKDHCWQEAAEAAVPSIPARPRS